MITDGAGAITYVNPAFTTITGWNRDEVIGKTPGSVLHSGKQDQKFYRAMWQGLLEEGHWAGEIWNRHKSGRIYAENITIDVIRNESGQTTHFVAVFSDISAQKNAEQHLNYVAFHDLVTGLPNRPMFEEECRRALSLAARQNANTAIFILDLDGFKAVNDTYGHAVGDALLREVANRLPKGVRTSDILARFGGDEFALLLSDTDGATGAVAMAERIRDLLSEPFRLEDVITSVGASIGISLFPDHGRDLGSLLRAADAAMYEAKRLGKNRFAVYAGPRIGEGP
jgi:diguanylate cyclase (GGDEF)-like protein/PAS domain S-box-containing protein